MKLKFGTCEKATMAFLCLQRSRYGKLLWSVVTYVCEAWTLKKKGENKIKASEMKGRRWILWIEKSANEWVGTRESMHSKRQ